MPGQRGTRLQWGKLLTLASAHSSADVFSGLISPLIPVIRETFGMSLTMAMALLATLTISSNAFQVMTGHMRARQRKMLFIPLGLSLSGALCFMGLLPAGTIGSVALFGLALLSGIGIAVLHPEGLRSVHTVKRIKPSTSTAVFITSGFVGYAAGGYLSTLLVSSWGLSSLLWLLAAPVISMVLLFIFKIRLAVENKQQQADSTPQINQWPFWPVWFLAIPITTATALMMALIPSRLEELGFELTLGGKVILFAGLGQVVGSFIWARLGERIGYMLSVTIGLALGVPLLISYLHFMDQRWSIILMVATGGCMGVFSMMVTMARGARGLNLGARMGLALGGSWGIACVITLAMAPLAERIGIAPILNLGWIGFLISLIIAIILMILRKLAKV